MVPEKFAWVLLGLVAVFAILGLVLMFVRVGYTGGFVTGGGGRWYYGPNIAKFTPQEACENAGCDSLVPQTVVRNQYGTELAVCDCAGEELQFPLVQVIFIAATSPLPLG